MDVQEANNQLECFLRNYYELLIQRKHEQKWTGDLILKEDLQIICDGYLEFLMKNKLLDDDATIGIVIIDPTNAVIVGKETKEKIDQATLKDSIIGEITQFKEKQGLTLQEKEKRIDKGLVPKLEDFFESSTDKSLEEPIENWLEASELLLTKFNATSIKTITNIFEKTRANFSKIPALFKTAEETAIKRIGLSSKEISLEIKKLKEEIEKCRTKNETDYSKVQEIIEKNNGALQESNENIKVIVEEFQGVIKSQYNKISKLLDETGKKQNDESTKLQEKISQNSQIFSKEIKKLLETISSSSETNSKSYFKLNKTTLGINEQLENNAKEIEKTLKEITSLQKSLKDDFTSLTYSIEKQSKTPFKENKTQKEEEKGKAKDSTNNIKAIETKKLLDELQAIKSKLSELDEKIELKTQEITGNIFEFSNGVKNDVQQLSTQITSFHENIKAQQSETNIKIEQLTNSTTTQTKNLGQSVCELWETLKLQNNKAIAEIQTITQEQEKTAFKIVEEINKLSNNLYRTNTAITNDLQSYRKNVDVKFRQLNQNYTVFKTNFDKAIADINSLFERLGVDLRNQNQENINLIKATEAALIERNKKQINAAKIILKETLKNMKKHLK
ncbi:MAG: hypothetical protein K9W42_10730 [Candidatus Heimdallarchaeota archaeon]|nr:hypothetical protein [Candidatus Heimdallarchaeota archaeon]